MKHSIRIILFFICIVSRVSSAQCVPKEPFCRTDPRTAPRQQDPSESWNRLWRGQVNDIKKMWENNAEVSFDVQSDRARALSVFDQVDHAQMINSGARYCYGMIVIRDVTYGLFERIDSFVDIISSIKSTDREYLGNELTVLNDTSAEGGGRQEWLDDQRAFFHAFDEDFDLLRDEISQLSDAPEIYPVEYYENKSVDRPFYETWGSGGNRYLNSYYHSYLKPKIQELLFHRPTVVNQWAQEVPGDLEPTPHHDIVHADYSKISTYMHELRQLSAKMQAASVGDDPSKQTFLASISQEEVEEDGESSHQRRRRVNKWTRPGYMLGQTLGLGGLVYILFKLRDAQQKIKKMKLVEKVEEVEIRALLKKSGIKILEKYPLEKQFEKIVEDYYRDPKYKALVEQLRRYLKNKNARTRADRNLVGWKIGAGVTGFLNLALFLKKLREKSR